MDSFLQRVIDQRDRETEQRSALEVRVSRLGKKCCEVCGDVLDDQSATVLRCPDCKDVVDFTPHPEVLIPVPDGFVPRTATMRCAHCGGEINYRSDGLEKHFHTSKPDCLAARKRWFRAERDKKYGLESNYVRCIACGYVWPSRLPKGQLPKACPICGPKPPPENGESMIMPEENPENVHDCPTCQERLSEDGVCRNRDCSNFCVPQLPEMTGFVDGKLEESPDIVDVPKEAPEEATQEVHLSGDEMATTKPVRHCPLDGIKLRSSNSTGWCFKHINPTSMRLKPGAYLQARRKDIKVPESLTPLGQVDAPRSDGEKPATKDKQGATPAPEPTVGSTQKTRSKPHSKLADQDVDDHDLGETLLQRAERYEAEATVLNEKAAQLRKTAALLRD